MARPRTTDTVQDTIVAVKMITGQSLSVAEVARRLEDRGEPHSSSGVC